MSGRMSILIVEDDMRTAHDLSALLSEEIPQLVIDKASTEREALHQLQEAKAANQPYDIVVLDFLLPQEELANLSGDPSK